jgi:hypothetical protein
MSTDASPAALLPITADAFRRLKAAVRALDGNLVLAAEKTDYGDDYISVDSYGPGQAQVVAHVLRNEAGWAVEGPLGGCVQFKPGDIEAVAAYLAFGSNKDERSSSSPLRGKDDE